MSENEKKGLQAMAVCMVAALLALLTFLSYEEAHKVRFADRRVGNAITMYSRTGKKPEDFRVEDFAKVEELVLGRPSLLETLSDIERCVNLKRLEIGVRGERGWIPKEEDILGEEGIARLERELADILESCGQLESLYIYNGNGTCSLSSLEFLENGKNLTDLILYGMGNLDYSPVFSFSNLQSLMLIGCRVTDSDIGEIGRLENLCALHLAGTDITEMGSVVELEGLELLFLNSTAIAEVEGIEELENLQWLDLSGTNITGLGSIVELENLELLYLSNTAIAEVEGIGKLENLRVLRLSGTEIAEAGELVNLKNLEKLYITDTPLAGNEEELKLLREALPDTEIVTNGVL